jgi:hypothetical protein
LLGIHNPKLFAPLTKGGSWCIINLKKITVDDTEAVENTEVSKKLPKASLRCKEFVFGCFFSARGKEVVDNGQILPPNSDFVTGKQAIQALWQGAMEWKLHREIFNSSMPALE